MESSVTILLFLQVILILLNAVFACAEIAVISMNDNKLAKMAAAGDKRALRLVRLTSQPARFLATIQVAITLSGFLGSAFAADNFSDGLVSWLIGLGVSIPAKTLDSIAVILITIILSFFTLVFGELVPKRIAMRKAEPLALGMSKFIDVIASIFSPIVWLLTVSTNGILHLMGIDPNAGDNDVSEEEIRMMVDVSSEKGVIDIQEKEFIQNVFKFDDMTAGDIATHRTEISILWMDETIEQWEQTIHDSRHSLYPVCDETADDIVGVLKVKDYFRLTEKAKETVIDTAVKPAYFVPESVKADVLFRNMKRTRNRMAIVLDEYGGISGLVTMNDLVEQLVGKFDDDDDAPEDMPVIERIDSMTWKISGSALLAEVEAALEISLPTDEHDTFGGLVFGAYGVIPEDGSKFQVETAGLVIRVIEISDHRIKKALVCLEEPTEQDI